ncbi:MAG: SGNH/GDSL hydrolase family protein [Clostridia bacterium]|nr:SGNH/GDSL hydrolase family protein [Clostridia bacterium]
MKRFAILLLACAIALIPALAAAPRALADDQVGSFLPLDPADYPKPVTHRPLGLAEGDPVADKYFNDAVFIGDSITLKLQRYVTARRNDGGSCLGRAKFLTAGSLGSGNALWDVSSESVHPSYQGEKMRIEKAVELMDAQKVYIMLGMNDVAYYGIEESIENMKKLVALILERQPSAEIFIQSATPRIAASHSKPTNRMLFDYDLLLYNACVENGWNFVDVAYVMRDENGCLFDAYCSDPEDMGMHFTDEGCEAWIDYLTTHAKGASK